MREAGWLPPDPHSVTRRGRRMLAFGGPSELFTYAWRLVGMPATKDPKRHAERMFKARQERQADAPKAIAEYYAAQEKLRERTKELRQLRLAREAQKNTKRKTG